MKRRLLTIAVLITMILLPATAFADTAVGETGAATAFAQGDIVYIDCGGDDYMFAERADQASGASERLFYHQEVEVIDYYADNDKARVKSEGRQYLVPRGCLTAKVLYKADTVLRQTIINKALSYNKGVTKTYYAFDSTRFSGPFPPNECKAGFDCSGFVKKMIEPEMRKTVFTYELPPSSGEMYTSMNKGEYIYNKGLNGACKITKVNLSSIRAGDIILFDKTGSGRATHVGLYLGNGDYIHCNHLFETTNETVGKYKRIEKYGGVFISRVNNSKSQIVGVISVVPARIAPANITVKAKSGTKLRKAADVNSTVLKSVSKGDSMTLRYTDRRGLWAYVTYKGVNGFISQNYINLAPNPTRITSLKAGKKAFTVKWKKGTGGASEYEIQYSLNKSFKNAKKVRISKRSTVRKTVKKLKSKKKYYVRVRTIKNMGTSYTYSKWSKASSIKTK